jgi:hypothetical protein
MWSFSCCSGVGRWSLLKPEKETPKMRLNGRKIRRRRQNASVKFPRPMRARKIPSINQNID